MNHDRTSEIKARGFGGSVEARGRTALLHVLVVVLALVPAVLLGLILWLDSQSDRTLEGRINAMMQVCAR